MYIETLARQFYDYSLYIRAYSPGTIQRYRQVIKGYCKFAGVERIDQVTESNVREVFYSGRTTRGWKTATFLTYHNTLTVFFRWCVQQGHLSANPVANIDVPKLEKRLPVKLNKQDAFKLLEVVFNYPYDYTFLRHRNHAVFAMFIYAGLRKSELLHLKLTDVDLENLSIFVRQGKGNKDRVIPISYALAESLKRYLAERKRLNKTCPEFFASLNRNVGFRDIGLRRLVTKIQEASGIKFTAHKLRHTFATLMLEGGCDIYSLSRMMGHSDIKTTTIYLYASVEHLRSQITKHPLNDLAR